MQDKDRINPGVLSWVEELRRVSVAVSKKTGRGAVNRNQLFYRLHWTRDGLRFGIDSFGASAPIDDLYAHFGLTVDAITPKILAKLGN